MKNIIFAMLFTLNACANGLLYIQKTTGNVMLENVVNNKLLTNSPVLGQTYIVNGQNYSLKTSTNSEALVSFSNDVAVRIKDSTHITLDTFDQKFINLNEYPIKAKYENSSLTTSLIEGELEVYSNQLQNDDSLTTVNTSLAAIILSKGKFVIQADDKTTILIILNGSAVVLDNSSRKKEFIKNNQTVVIVPAPRFQGRSADTLKRGNIFTIKETAKTDAESYLLGVNSIEADYKNVRFIVIDKNVRGATID